MIVFQHIPASTTQYLRRGRSQPGSGSHTTNSDELYALLDPYPAHILSGHLHESEHVYEGNTHEHAMGTVCAAWWTGPIAGDGSPLGYSVYEVDGEDIRWRYKATGHPDDYQMRVYEPGADSDYPNEMIANVWDWNPDWTVVWYEDGIRKGEMTQRTALDPLSVKLHAGDARPSRRTWVEPIPTKHLFYAPVSPDAGNVRVEAVDGFGRRYNAEPEAL